MIIQYRKGMNIIKGFCLGLSISVISIVSMDGIITRPDENGNMIYTFTNIYDYLVLPFSKEKHKRNLIWGLFSEFSFKDRIKFLSMNWIFMTGLCTGLFMIFT